MKDEHIKEAHQVGALSDLCSIQQTLVIMEADPERTLQPTDTSRT